jgi:hypothetical protein
VKILAPVGRYLFLGLWPMVFGVFVSVGSGVGWGLAEAVALYAWWLPSLVFRRSTWPLRHQYWAFAHFVYIFATLVFAFLAGVPLHLITRWPMWVCVLLAPVIGGGVTIALWPAQRRFHAARISLLSPGAWESSPIQGVGLLADEEDGSASGGYLFTAVPDAPLMTLTESVIVRATCFSVSVPPEELPAGQCYLLGGPRLLTCEVVQVDDKPAPHVPRSIRRARFGTVVMGHPAGTQVTPISVERIEDWEEWRRREAPSSGRI